MKVPVKRVRRVKRRSRSTAAVTSLAAILVDPPLFFESTNW